MRHAINVLCLAAVAALLSACGAGDLTERYIPNDEIAGQLLAVNAARAGEAGRPVQLTRIDNALNGDLSIQVRSDDGRCLYYLNGKVSHGHIDVSANVMSECGKARTLGRILATLIPRNKPRAQSECRQPIDAARVQCLLAVEAANEQLALAEIR